MSEPTYRIDVERREGTDIPAGNRYRATVIRLSDNTVITCEYGRDAEAAKALGQEAIANIRAEPRQTFYTDDDGEIVTLPRAVSTPEPQSLRA